MTAAREAGAPTRVKVGQAKGRPMLSWVGKHPLRELTVFPAQEVERFALEGSATSAVDWSDWPAKYPQGGLLVHGDNKEVLAHLIANGFRGKVDLVYIDPPFGAWKTGAMKHGTPTIRPAAKSTARRTTCSMRSVNASSKASSTSRCLRFGGS